MGFLQLYPKEPIHFSGVGRTHTAEAARAGSDLTCQTCHNYRGYDWWFGTMDHRIGWWENLQENPIFDGKNHGFPMNGLLWLSIQLDRGYYKHVARNIWFVTLVTGWWFGTFGLWLSIQLGMECHHPNWLSHIFQRGRSTTNQRMYGHDFPTKCHRCLSIILKKQSVRTQEAISGPFA